MPRADLSSPGTPPEPTREIVNAETGDWYCRECGAVNVKERIRCRCCKLRRAPLAPSSAPAPEHVPESEQNQDKTAKSLPAVASQLESRASRDALLREFWHAVCEWERHNMRNNKHTPDELRRAYERAQAASDAVESRLTDLTRDAERLDWLEAVRPRVGLGEEREARLLSRVGDGDLLASEPTLRAAIDAAMDSAPWDDGGGRPASPDPLAQWRPEAAAVDPSRSYPEGAAALTPTLAAPTGAAAPTDNAVWDYGPGRTIAPWTPEQVALLNNYQTASGFHPFTCGSGKCSHVSLVAREDGWHCPSCDYTQRWAHNFMTRPFQDPREYPAASPAGRAPARAGTTPEQEQNQGKTTNGQRREPLLKGESPMDAQELLDREVSCSRSYLVALQYIAEMVGMDTRTDPPEGVWSVVEAVDEYVRLHNLACGARTLDEAKARCAENWINEQLAREPLATGHERAARAYYAELERAHGKSAPGEVEEAESDGPPFTDEQAAALGRRLAENRSCRPAVEVDTGGDV